MVPNYDYFRSIQHYWTHAQWLAGRMLFLSGPRQVGKTTLIRHHLVPDKSNYFNWDAPQVRRAYQKNAGFFSHDIKEQGQWIAFDEIHKRPKWKNILKGIYDNYKEEFRFVVTGSARLETFRRSGDSLVGRYFHTRLFPLNLGDFRKKDFKLPKTANKLIEEALDQKDHQALADLLAYGGFPEPFFAAKENFWRRWSKQHQELILREDLRDLSRIVEVDKVEALLHMLASSISHTVSYRSLARDLETDHNSIRRWLSNLNRLHLIFSIAPYAKKIRRSFSREKKFYYTDWRAASENIFENYVAATLLRACCLWEDRYGESFELGFIRTFDGTEVDFVLLREKKPWLLIEAKTGQSTITRGLYRFSQELKVPGVSVTARPHVAKKIQKSKKDPALYQVSFSRLASLLP